MNPSVPNTSGSDSRTDSSSSTIATRTWAPITWASKRRSRRGHRARRSVSVLHHEQEDRQCKPHPTQCRAIGHMRCAPSHRRGTTARHAPSHSSRALQPLRHICRNGSRHSLRRFQARIPTRTGGGDFYRAFRPRPRHPDSARPSRFDRCEVVECAVAPGRATLSAADQQLRALLHPGAPRRKSQQASRASSQLPRAFSNTACASIARLPVLTSSPRREHFVA
jgi:hypothetical protein